MSYDVKDLFRMLIILSKLHLNLYMSLLFLLTGRTKTILEKEKLKYCKFVKQRKKHW
jgi:hypothetical protein